MRPVVGGRIPEIVSKNVVLPAPLGPISPHTSLAKKSRVTSLKAVTPPKRTPTSTACSSARGRSAGRSPTSASVTVTQQPSEGSSQLRPEVRLHETLIVDVGARPSPHDVAELDERRVVG